MPSQALLTVGQLATGTVAAGQTIEYAMSAPAGATFFVSFEATSGSAADTLVATVRRASSGATLLTLRSAGTQAELHDLMLTLAPAVEARDLVVSVAGVGPTHAGPFQLVVRPMTSAPERASAIILSNGEVREAIDAPGDVDEFQIAASGAYIGWVQFASESPVAEGLHLELLDGATVLATVSTTAAQSTLDELQTDLFAFPRTGTYTIRVRAGSDPGSTGTGSYRARVIIIPPASPPIQQDLLLSAPVVDTLTSSDSVAAFRFYIRTTVRYGFTVELLGGAPNDTITVTFLNADVGEALGVAVEAAGNGPTSFLLPVAPSASANAVVATVHQKRRGMVARYRVRLGSPLSDAPESVSATLVFGDTVIGETIGDLLDMDQYMIPAVPDSEWVVMLAPTDSLQPPLSVRVHDQDSRQVAEWGVSGLSPALERTATYLKLVGGGPYTVTVRGSGFVGPYRLRVLRRDRGTESAPTDVSAGQIFRGSIEDPGDIDEFRFNALEGQEVYFHYRHLGGGGHAFTLLDGGTVQEYIGPLANHRLPYDQVEFIRWRAPRTGTFTLRMQNGDLAGPPTNWPGLYEVEIQLVQRAPEVASATGWAYGDTIGGESLERRGDIDEFEITFDTTQMTRLVFVAHRASALDEVAVVALDHDGNQMGGAGLGEAEGSDTIAAMAHLEFQTAGTYRFRVQSNSLHPVPYRFFLVPSYLGPETISDTLSVGVWVAGEAIDSIGDADRFYFPVDSGESYVVEIEGRPGSTGRFWFLSDVAHAVSNGTRGTWVSSVSGWMKAMVHHWPSPDGPTQGPYRLRILPVRPAPETAAPTMSIGDSVTTESIDLYGDVDTFTFTGAAGDALRLVARSGASATGARLWVQVHSLTGTGLVNFDFDTERADFTLPAAGTYRIVVAAWNRLTERDLGPYLLAVTRR